MTISLEEILDAREKRAELQHFLLSEYHMPLICLTLNIAGETKRYKNADRFFDEGVQLINQHLSRCGIVIKNHLTKEPLTGKEGYWSVEGSARDVKRMMVQIEDAFPAARLLDIDVLDVSGEKLSRSDIGHAARLCLICGEVAAGCARSRQHGLDAVVHRTEQLLCDYFDNCTAEHIAAIATKSLLYEVCITPKPGLVDRANQGAHRDMDIFTFADSISVLTPYFKQCALKGIRSQAVSPAQLFSSLRYIGQCAEDTMFDATKGINTHKGAIYSLGVLCAAAGRLSEQAPYSAEQICKLCSDMTRSETDTDLLKIAQSDSATTGERLYTQYGISGIRGEVAAGFPSVREVSLPVFRRLLEQGLSINDAGAVSLLHLMAVVTDTNMIARSSVTRQRALQDELTVLLQSDENPGTAYLNQLDTRLIAENISPGGCADLLSITLLLHFLTTNL